MSASTRILVLQRPDPSLEPVFTRLEGAGCLLHACADAEEMLRALETQDADIVMIDAAVEDGMAVVGALKARAETRSLPVAMLTSDPNGVVAAEALALGADDLFVLPIDDAELLARVRALARLAGMEVERRLRDELLAEFGVRSPREPPGVPAIDRLSILLVGPAGLDQIQVTTALGGAATVAYAETVESALERLMRHDIDVAVITGAWDVADLRRLCREIRADPRLFDLPVVLIGRTDAYPDRGQPIKWGVSDLLFQPFHPEILRLRVQSWVRQQRLRRRLRGALNDDALPPTIDRLTRLHGHGFLHAYVERHIARAHQSGLPLAIVGFEVAGMAGINRTYGFAAGDRVLAQIGTVLARVTRAEDLPARVDGDRFALVVAGTSGRDAEIVAERIWRILTTNPLGLPGGRSLRLELRAAIAELAAGDDAPTLIARAFAPPPPLLDLRQAS